MGLKITNQQLAVELGYPSVEAMLEDFHNKSIVPACCDESCDVEPDGKCPHGHPSCLVEAGRI